MEREVVHYSEEDKKNEDKSIDPDHPHRIEGKVVEFPDIGAKVKRGPDWIYGPQDQGAIYGIITDKASEYFNVKVCWIRETKDGLSKGPAFYYRTGEVTSCVDRKKTEIKYDLVYADQNL